MKTKSDHWVIVCLLAFQIFDIKRLSIKCYAYKVSKLLQLAKNTTFMKLKCHQTYRRYWNFTTLRRQLRQIIILALLTRAP